MTTQSSRAFLSQNAADIRLLAFPERMVTQQKRSDAMQRLAISLAKNGQSIQALELIGECGMGPALSETTRRVVRHIRLQGGLDRPVLARKALEKLSMHFGHGDPTVEEDNATEWRRCATTMMQRDNPVLSRVLVNEIKFVLEGSAQPKDLSLYLTVTEIQNKMNLRTPAPK